MRAPTAIHSSRQQVKVVIAATVFTIAIFGSVMMAGGLLLLSRQSNLFKLQLLYLLIGALGLGCLYSPVLATVGLWFEKRRGLALGIVTAGGTLGQGLIPLAVQELLEVGAKLTS
jgi:MFS family permease